MNQKNYTVSELTDNPSFRRIVKGTATPDEIEKWNNWIEENDQNRENAKSAISEIVGFKFADPEHPDIKNQWSDLYTKTVGKQKKQLYQGSRKNDSLKWLLRATAVILVMTMVGLGIYYNYKNDESPTQLELLAQETTITTTEGEQKTLKFSNGSRVVINSNSTFTYRFGLPHNQAIYVSLEGEAWFDVKSDPSQIQPAFEVTTPDGIIRDIGTKFLVTVQDGWSRVVLQDGRVEVVNVDREDSQSERFSIEKGEMVEFTRTNILKREMVNPTFYTSWATEFMQFDQTGIREFADYVEQRFGVKVQIEDPELSEITLDGAVYFRSLEELVRSVSDVTGIPVYQSEDRMTVYIGNPNE